MNEKVERLAEEIGSMDKAAARELGNALMRALGIRMPSATVPPVSTTLKPVVEEQTEFTVTLTGYAEEKKIAVIKVMRELTGLGLKEAKEAVESKAHMIRSDVSKQDAEGIRTRITEAGGTVTIT